MKKRIGLLSGVAGAVAAGAAVVLAVDRSAAKRQRGQDAGAELGQWPVDRSGRVVVDDGVGLYYEEVGPLDAPLTVIFVHGYCLQMGEFVFQCRALAAELSRGPTMGGTLAGGSANGGSLSQGRLDQPVRLVFFDQRSHGRSDRGQSEHANIDQLGYDLGAVLDTLAPQGKILLVGHSMGGMAVMALADQRPQLFAASGHRPGAQRVVGVTLLSTSAGRLAAVTLGLPAALARVREPIVPILLRGARRQGDLIERGRAFGTDVAWVFTRKLSFAGADVDPATVAYLTHMIAETRIEVVADFYPAVMSHDKLAALPVLKDLEVLVMCGDRDLLTPLSHSQQIAAALPGAELVTIPDAGHVALMEQPEVVTDALIRLINSVLAKKPAKRWRRG